MRETFTPDEGCVRIQCKNLRGREIEPTVVANEGGGVVVMERKWLDDFITGAGVVPTHQPLPEPVNERQTSTDNALKAINNRSQGVKQVGVQLYGIYPMADGTYVGLRTSKLQKALHYLVPTKPTPGKLYDPDDFELYRPTGSKGTMGRDSPFVLVSTHTPEHFIINRLFGSKREFLVEYGASACRECEQVFEQHFVECPECGTRPKEVQHNLDLIAEKHPGCMALIFAFNPPEGKLADAVEDHGAFDPEEAEPEAPEAD